MRLHITLDMSTADDIAKRAVRACHYWAGDPDPAETLPSHAALRTLLTKRIEVATPSLLRTIANDDVWAVDTLVQLAMFGELRFG